MTRRVAFLRAVNLGPRRKFPAADIRRVLDAAGYADIETYIASGNVRFDGRTRTQAKLEAHLEAVFLADREFEVPTFVFDMTELRRIVADADELAAGRELARHYVYLMREPLEHGVIAALAERASDAGEMVARGRAVHALLRPGYQDGVVDPLNAARLLPVATNRNAKVIREIVDRWS